MRTEFVSPGEHRTAGAFRDHLRAVAPDLDCDLELEPAPHGPLAQPLQVLGRRVGNRFAVQPMEGWDGTREGLPSEHTRRRWRHFGQSGAKLVWGGEAFAVQADGRANPSQLWRNEDAGIEPAMHGLLAELRAAHRALGTTDDLLVGLQLTHSGRFAKPIDRFAPKILYRHPVLDARYGVAADHPLLSDGELEAIGESFVRAARLAQRTGFDFVDVKCCHGYLLHECLAARTRAGPYGGSFANRTRLFRRIVEAIRAACPGLGIAVRVSLADRFPHAPHPDTRQGEPRGLAEHVPYVWGFGVDAQDPMRFDLDEPLRFLGLLAELGIELVNVTLGSPYWVPHLQRPAVYPPSDGYLPPRDPLCDVAEHLRVVRAAKRAFPELVIVGTGYSYLQEWLPHVAQAEVRAGHVDSVGLGRMMLAYPGLAHDVLRGAPLTRKHVCRTFSDCTTGPRNGMISGCYPLDPYYKALPEAARVKEIRRRLG